MAKDKRNRKPPRQGELRRISGDELKKIKLGPIRHTEGLDPLQTAWARSLYRRVGYVIEPSFEQWELGFMRDMHPTSELWLWEAISRTVESYLSDHPEADVDETVGLTTGVTVGAEFEQETEQTRDLRRRSQEIRNRIADDLESAAWELVESLKADDDLNEGEED